MNDLQPIIAAIDFSPSAPSVLHHSLYASASTSAPVVALHVLDSGRVSAMSEEFSAEAIKEQAREKLVEWIASKTSVEPPKTEIRIGQPAKEIQKSVQENQANLLVVAANDTRKNRLGAIASRCVRTVPCDVLVLRRTQRGNFKKLLVCADFSQTSSLALGRAAAIALKEEAELEIVHVMYPPGKDIWGEALEQRMDSPVSYKEKCRAKANASMESFIAPHLEILSQITYLCTIQESVNASLAITSHVAKTGVDLVVMGTHGHSPIMSHFLGTNAERLMNDSAVSVLAVRSPQGSRE